ncbi:DUF465 domain-containing protein [Pararobbsia alpina]|jgi:hypothetical protein|uniref:DUF465 domain-containing protein n=1 Tax=Pararobbsia alpina TaxID=621374 RepID=A0A6S7BFQ6_9BURK|nr:DUF465 domain-containing protein [Pararobbsia alpina]CAB3798728.1 hypothetical protein LMG28138_04518 [Pararobbsia alpina]
MEVTPTIDASAVRGRIAELEAEHHGLNGLIGKLAEIPGVNDFELQRLKKRKLKVKDTIILLKLQLEPDGHA